MADKRNDETSDLDRRLEELGSKLAERNIGQENKVSAGGLKDTNGIAYGLKLGSEFVAAIVVGCVIGWFVDQWAGTSPFGLIVFLILGFAAGILNVMRATGQVSQPGTGYHDGNK